MTVLALASSAWMIIASGLLPRPNLPSQPTSPPAGDVADDSSDDGGSDSGAPNSDADEPMSDAELEQLSVPIDEPVDVESEVEPTITPSTPTDRKASARSINDAFPNRPPKETCAPSETGLPATSVLAPRLIEPRWEPGAALLGGLVGFGAGHFYANASERGIVLGVADTLLLGGLTATLIAREHNGGGTETTLTGLSWGLGIAAGVSRIFQAFDAYHAAARTNDELRRVSFVPLASAMPLRGGGALALGFTW